MRRAIMERKASREMNAASKWCMSHLQKPMTSVIIALRALRSEESDEDIRHAMTSRYPDFPEIVMKAAGIE